MDWIAMSNKIKIFQKKKPIFRDPRDYATDNWRNTRMAAYRDFTTYLAKPKGLVCVGIGIFLGKIYFLNIIYGLLVNFSFVVQNFTHGREINYWTLGKGLYYPYIFINPGLFVLFSVFFLGSTGVLLFKIYQSFHALEDIQNATTNRWTKTDELVGQYRIAWSDPNEPIEGVGGVPIAYIRPSMLEVFGKNRPRVLDDSVLEGMNIVHEDADKKVVAGTEEEKKYILKNAGILRKELTENVQEYGMLLADEIINVIVIGITRSGKGVFFVNADIDAFSRSKDIKDRASFFIADTKGVILRENYKMLKERGYEILVFNVADPFMSNPFSPLFTATYNYEDYLFNKDLSLAGRNKRLDFAVQDITRLANILYPRPDKGGDTFFIDNSRAFFRAMSLSLIEHCLQIKQKDKICLFTVSTTTSKMMSIKINKKHHSYLKRYVNDNRDLDSLYTDYKGKTALDVYFGEMPNTHPAKVAYSSIDMAGGAEQTLAGIASGMMIALEPYVRSGNARLTATNSFDFRKMGFGDKPQAVFLIVPDSDSSNEELATLFLEQSYQELQRETDARKDARCERPVIYLLDEFANLMQIPNMDKKMSAALSRNIRFHIVIQNIGQLLKYGPSVEETILGNGGLTIYIKSNDKKTNDLISARLGKRSVYSFTRQGNKLSFNKTVTESVKEVDMMSISELENMQFGENIILRNMKSEDLEGNVLTALPILNRGTERMIPSFWYLKHEKAAWEDIPIQNTHVELSLDDYVIELISLEILEREHKERLEAIEKEKLEQLEQYKQWFTDQLKATYKLGLVHLCRDVLKEKVTEIQNALFHEEILRKSESKRRENLEGGLNRLLSDSVKEFTEWLLTENDINSLQTVSFILDLKEIEKEGQNEQTQETVQQTISKSKPIFHENH